jgi:predicted dinucleotide-binding enzyme
MFMVGRQGGEGMETIFAELLPSAARESRAIPVQVFIAGDDEAAKKVSDLVAATGLSGALTNSRYFEPVRDDEQVGAHRTASRSMAWENAFIILAWPSMWSLTPCNRSC